MNRRGLYLLADEAVLPFTAWPSVMPRILDQGPALVQYRGKAQRAAARERHATVLLDWCRERELALLINDDPELAMAIGAAGVHLGRDDPGIRAARQQLGPQALIGSSCYDDLARARACREAGASYVSFGRLFASATKPGATPASLDILRRARAALDGPICAIGGIGERNAAAVLRAGADLICVAGGILAEPDPVAAARNLATICRTHFASRA